MLSDKVGVLVRPYGKDTLYDRLSTRPFLVPIEKQWIAFQLLKALEQCHEVDVCHGDLKCENVVVSSSNWVSVVDFASVKPTYLPHDNPSDYSLFFDTGRRRTCYLAPERFMSTVALNAAQVPGSFATAPGSDPAMPKHNPPLAHAMDIFSLGCVLIEMLTDGCAPFDFSQMLAFRQAKYRPEHLIEKIDCPHMRDLVRRMLSKKPQDRGSAPELLSWQRGKAFPDLFYRFLWPYLSQFQVTPLKLPDDQISQLMKDKDIILEQTLPNDKPCLVIILSHILSCLRSLKFARRKLDALELVQCLSARLSDEVIMDRILPYMLSMLTDQTAMIREAAINTIAQCLVVVKSPSPSDLRIFSEFILPKLTLAVSDPAPIVRLAFAQNVATFAECAQRFLEYAKNHSVVDPQVQMSPVAECSSTLEFDEELRNIQDTLQDMVVTLICRSNANVRRTLVHSNLKGLCGFFGRQKASDVLLSHMITFLNDKTDWSLRAAFFETVPELAEYVGWQCCTILRPLLQQGLRDFEENVIYKTALCLCELARRKVLRKPTVYELAQDCVPFLCHPNSWIRNATCSFFVELSVCLNVADMHCKVMPMLQPYLRYPLIRVDKQSVLLQSLEDPIPRDIYDVVIKSPLVSLLLEFLRDKHLVRQLSRTNQESVGYAPEDQSLLQLYQKLVSRGLTEDIEKRLLAFRDILLKMQKLRQTSVSSMSITGSQSGVVDLAQLSANRRHVELSFNSNGDEGSIVYVSPYSNFDPNGSLNNLNEEWQEMFGIASQARQKEASPAREAEVESASATTAPASDTNTISSTTSSTFEKPNIDAALSMSIQNATQDATGFVVAECQNSLHEFLDWKRQQTRRHTAVHSDSVAPKGIVIDDDWKPSGRLVAHLHEHHGAINKLSAHHGGSLFASCSSDGFIKLWDTERIEGRSMANRSRCTTAKQGGKIKFISFLPESDDFVATSDNCSVVLYKLHSGSKAEQQASWQTNPETEGHIVDMTTFSAGGASYLVGASHHGHVICWDTRSRDVTWRFTNPFKHGLVSCLCVDSVSHQWAAVGTDSGYLITWDLRFQLPINVTHHPKYRCLYRLWPHNRGGKSSSVIGSFMGNGEVSIWDLESSTRTFALWPVDKPILSYQQTAEVTTSSVLWGSTAKSSFAVTGDSQAAIRVWDFEDYKKSYVMSEVGAELKQRTYQYKCDVTDGVEVISESWNQRSSAISRGSTAGGGASSDFGQFKSPLETTPTTAHHDTISDLIFTKTTQMFLVSASMDGVIKVWK